ncbi:MAG: pyrroloquinoline quinone biosynthesis peptide chaperone PqqD [Steroidobacter sp.]
MSAESRPAIRSGFRLQWEPVQNAYVMLYPEGMITLNTSAAEILRRCDGSHTVDEIVEELEVAFQHKGLKDDVAAFLDGAASQGWVHMVQP